MKCYHHFDESFNPISMNIQIHTRNFKIPASLREQIEAQTSKLGKYFKNLIGIHVDIVRDRHHKKGEVFRVECNVHIPRKIIRGIKTGETLLLALGSVEKILKAKVSEENKKRKDQKRLPAQDTE